MTIGSRVFRSLLAASTLHLMLAVPARACEMAEMAPSAAAPATTQAMPATMMHAGHQMTPAMASEAPPATPYTTGHEGPCGSHMPCCPIPASCTSGGHATAIVQIADAIAPATMPSIAPSVSVDRWVSFVTAPEPPPPRA